ncbi:SGNH/GDSL hydrolase family protein [Lactococcus petauri]|uniref:SGNH/GDSL hydrolase family protein n=1 Tax=Lactococcus petauri TaxID=1940789 RepID=UPI0038553B54
MNTNQTQREKVLCIGDSLTLGKLGYAYTQFLKDQFEVNNLGKNGDTTWGIFRRGIATLQKNEAEKYSFIIIGAGTNDLLLPYQSYSYPIIRILIHLIQKKRQCTKSIEEFKVVYDDGIRKIRLLTNAPVLLVGIPFMELADFPQKKVEEYNKVIQTIAEEYGLCFVDYSGVIDSDSLMEIRTEGYSWRNKSYVRIIDYGMMCIFGKCRDWLGARRKLQYTVDGVHFNLQTAKHLFKKIQQIIER